MVNFDIEDLDIIVKLNQKGSMLAQIELRYGPLRIFGYRVMHSDYGDGLYVQPPSVKAGSHWLWLVRVDNPEIWSDLEKRIKEAYLSEVEKHGQESREQENDLEIDPDDLPF